MLKLLADLMPHLTVHMAAQSSHDLAISLPFDDIEANAFGALNLIEAVRTPPTRSSAI